MTQYFLFGSAVYFSRKSQANEFIHISGSHSGNHSNWKSPDLSRSNNETFREGKEY